MNEMVFQGPRLERPMKITTKHEWNGLSRVEITTKHEWNGLSLAFQVLDFENCSIFFGCLKIIWNHLKNFEKIKKEKMVHFVFLNKGA
jgi:hypothetical protein